jgi:hypothetical protein
MKIDFQSAGGFNLLGLLVVASILAAPAALLGKNADFGEASAVTNIPAMRTYPVGKKVLEFPANDDFSTPEAAYAALYRAYVAEGDAMWPRLSIRSLAESLSTAAKKPLPAEIAESELNAEVVEVRFCDATSATVFARLQFGNDPKVQGIDIRSFGLENGHWLNAGEDVAATLENAREKFALCLPRSRTQVVIARTDRQP